MMRHQCRAGVLSAYGINTTQGQSEAVRLSNLTGGPAGAFLTAMLDMPAAITVDQDIVAESSHTWPFKVKNKYKLSVVLCLMNLEGCV